MAARPAARPSCLTLAAIATTVLAGCALGSGPAGSPKPAVSTNRTHPAGAASPSAAPAQFTIAFAGDVNFAERTAKRLDDPATAFAEAAPALSAADLTMVNLETAITTGGVRQNKAFAFRAPPSALTALRDAGVDVATMANNHGADFGTPGLRDTLAAIATSGFPVIGIGADADAAYAPYRTILAGTRVAIFAADQVQDETTLRLFSAGPDKPGVANARTGRLVREVAAAHRAGYLVVVYLHWGTELDTCPNADQTALAAQLAGAGAAAIVGTHAHVLQGAGWRPDGSYVAYGLGNYLWWRSYHNEQDDNGVLTLTFRDGKVVAARFAAAHLDARGVPVPATGATKSRIDAEWARDRGCADLSATPPR